MKTLCRLPDFIFPNVSLYLFDDSEPVCVTSTNVIVGDIDNPEYVILDCNETNCILYENVSEPFEWQGWKYFYNPTDGWVLNPDWVDPAEPPQPVPIELN